SARSRAAGDRALLGFARAGRARLRRDRHRAFLDRLRPRRRGVATRRRPPQRHRQQRPRGRESLEVVTRVALAGLGYWGPNLARNFDDLAELRWLCDASPDALEPFTARYPRARTTTSYDELLADDELDAVVVATPAVTHYELAKRALEAGKHVLVEKPPAMNAADAADLGATAEASKRVLMPGHLLLYHPAVRAMKPLVDAGELGDVLCG